MRRTFTALVLAFSVVGCSISRQQEAEMGRDYAIQINQQLPIVQDAEVNRYINLLGDSIARLTSAPDHNWTFFIVDSPEVNAFAVPGGYVYVNRGLIARTDRMDELAGVLGHEIGHVVERHSVEQMEKAQRAELGIGLACVLTGACGSQAAGTLINVAGTAVFAKFSREAELEADDVGFDNVVRAGISPQGIATMFQKLLEERRTRPSAVEGWFATHPLEEDRLVRIQARIAQIPAAQLSRLARDSQNYQTFRRRLNSLPPSPAPRR
ncbi:MAG: M48 family metallopeptidase [Gemmatimonadaceae bacterium]|nr:M48 family metallopeptidase [Gemmatimonadaceae bacterium]